MSNVWNAEPETVALATLDALERCVQPRGFHDIEEGDEEFMDSSLRFYLARLRTLKMEAAAGWGNGFEKMLERCHSITIEPSDYQEKEGVRTKKMKCMACGRWEHCCRFMLSGIGPFESTQWSNVKKYHDLLRPWKDFLDSYLSVCSDEYVSRTRIGRLPNEDMGAYAIGKTCMRKAQLYYMANTFILESCYSAYQDCLERGSPAVEKGAWFHATDQNAAAFVERLDQLELAIADEKRPVPHLFVDQQIWDKIETAREKASADDFDEQLRLMRERAANMLQGGGELEDGSEQEEENGDGAAAHVGCSESEEEDNCPKRRRRAWGTSAQRRRCIEDDDDDVSSCKSVEASAGAKKGVQASKGKRRSRRIAQLSPADIEDSMPHNQGRGAVTKPPRQDCAEQDDDLAHEREEEQAQEEQAQAQPSAHAALAPRTAPPNAAEMASEARMPGGRLPSRRTAQINLSRLMITLLREGRDSDAAVCNQALFTIQELSAECARRAHSADR